MPKHNRKNGKHALMKRRQQVASLYVRGASQFDIAADLKVSQPTVSRDLEAIRKLWIESTLADFTERLALELARIDELERVAWVEFEKSRQPKTTTTSKREARAQRGRRGGLIRLVPEVEVTTETETEKTGDPRFLDQVRWCVETRLKLLGAFTNSEAATKIIVNWDQLYRQPDQIEIIDPVEVELRKLEGKEPLDE